MKLSAEQIEICRKIISSQIKYQETLEEVLDHVISAIEGMPESNETIMTLTEQVIDRDFGGKNNLKAMEKEREKVLLKALYRKQKIYFLEHFKFPLISFTLLLALTSYLTVDTYINRKVFLIALDIFSFSPVLLLCFKSFGIQLSGSKKSIKIAPLLQVSYLSIAMFNIFNFVPKLFYNDNYKFLIRTNTAVLSVITVFFVVYTISFIKLYREEIKMKLA
ncbi:hypothetical protein [Mucilaginibacter sp. KACC 22063]|uniref:hypothetical protein n=1 Tax=Mucilaginibacter sp. KACC 22063 TaxID=3025666 RepID=UPI002365D551|nr:hypothetical protein [Mucilaginibacter sp. KACC 22063]WDF56779.1 hypothetical protein PQ461_06895 [Mucilaginibacter sp. KACC 22063]